jgi:hypothetical protein
MKNNIYIRLIYLVCGLLIAFKAQGMEQLFIPVPTTPMTIDVFDIGRTQGPYQRPQSPFRGDSSWANVLLVQDCTMASVGINPDANLLDTAMRTLEAPSTVDNTSLSQTAFVNAASENSAVHSKSESVDAQNPPVQTQSSQESQITHETSKTQEYSFSDLTTYDQRHAIDSPSLSANQEPSAPINHYRNKSIATQELAHTEQIKRLESLLALSDNPTSLGAQLEVSMGNSGVSRKIFREEIQAEYRDFLWDSSNHFKPINTPERQQQALDILYPAIKTYFSRDQKGLVQFLEKHAARGEPGFQRLLNLETGKASYGESLSNFGRDCSSSLGSLNVFHSVPTIETIKKSPFLQDLSKLVSNIKTGQLAQAKAIIEQFQKKISSASDSIRPAMIKEYNCLCAQYTALTEKLFEKYAADPRYQACLGQINRGSLQKSEAFKILEARHYAANSLAYGMGYDLKSLSAHDKNLIYGEINIKTRDSYGHADLLAHKDLLSKGEVNTLKEKLECFEPQKTSEQHLTQKNAHAMQETIENTGVAPHEETEPIEPPSQIAQQESSITASPPPLDPKEPKQKKESATDSQNKQIEKDGLKESSIYKKAIESIEKNVHRFEKIGINQLSKKVLRHIINHHYKIGEVAKRRDQTSMFKDDINLVDLILETLENGIEIEPGVKTYDCGKIIGHSLNGEPTTVIAVFLNSAKNMITTVFPR